MTFAEACAWSLLRSLVVTTVGLAIASKLRRSFEAATPGRASQLRGQALLPVFVPGLLIGYGYRNFSLSLVHYPVWNELLYSVLVMMQVVPVGMLVLVCSPPPPVSASALHVRRLFTLRFASSSRRHGRLGFLADWLRHHLFALVPAAATMFLLAFQESEVATLMQVPSWTEWLFTRYFVGLQNSVALKSLIAPVVIQLAVIVSAGWVVSSSGDANGTLTQTKSPLKRKYDWLSIAYLGAAILIVGVLPGGIVLRGTWDGFAVLQAHRTLLNEIGLAVILSTAAGLIAWGLSGWLASRRSSGGNLLMILLCLPGLMGALALGVTASSVIQSEPLVQYRDTPLPLLLAEICFLLPRAWLFRLIIGGWRQSSSVHAAWMLLAAPDRRRQQEAARLRWRLDVAGRCGGLLLVCNWAYVELTLPSLLAPPGMTPAPVVLYNLMHYGQISGLSAMLFATMTVPVVLIGVSWWGFRAMAGRLPRF